MIARDLANAQSRAFQAYEISAREFRNRPSIATAREAENRFRDLLPFIVGPDASPDEALAGLRRTMGAVIAGGGHGAN